VTPVAHWA